MTQHSQSNESKNSLSTLSIGSMVLLQNLTNEKFNGKKGTICEYNSTSGRYTVMLTDNLKAIAVLSKNLKIDPTEKKKYEDTLATMSGNNGNNGVFPLLISGIIIYFCYKYFIEPGPVITCLKDQPLVISEPDIYSIENFTQFYADLDEDERWKCAQFILQEINKTDTTNFVLRFNNEGVKQLGSEVLINFFQKIRIPEANAFSLSVLVIAPSGEEYQKFAINTRRSELDIIDSTKSFVAHQVNVFYVSRPKYLNGGELHIFPPANKPSKASDISKASIIQPVENTLITFRGDAWYRFMNHQTLDQTFPIISIILEQYIIPEKEYKKTVVFEEVKPQRHPMISLDENNLYTVLACLVAYSLIQQMMKR